MTYRGNDILSRSLTIVLLLLWIPQLVVAQPQTPALGFSDHSLIAGFPDSEILERELFRDINYRVVLGGLERVRGEIIPEDSARLRGDVTKITYEVSQEFTSDDVYAFFQQQLSEMNYELLFSCEGRACGSSNYWANDIFRNRNLYGPERNQYFMAFRANLGHESDPYFSLYIITRVNRQIYAHLEVVEPAGTSEPEQIAVVEDSTQALPAGPASTSSLLGELRERGSVVLPPFRFRADDTLATPVNVEQLVSELNADPSLSVYVVAHLRQEGESLQELMRRSTSRANSLRQILIEAGIAAQRIEAAGVGPLAPACDQESCAERIELVLR